MAVLDGCASASRPSAAAVNARTFGDTSAYGLRINTLDPVQETAGAQLAQSAYIIVLAVRPGRDIELISPIADLPPATAKAGRLDVSMQRFEDDLTDLEAEDAKAQLAFDRCVSNAEAQARREGRRAHARARKPTAPARSCPAEAPPATRWFRPMRPPDDAARRALRDPNPNVCLRASRPNATSWSSRLPYR